MSLEFSETFLAASYRGLSSLDAEVRAQEYGKNVRPARKKKNSFQVLWGIISEPMILILIGTTIIYYFIGSHTETLIFAISIVPVVLIQYLQERRTGKAIQMLDSLLVEECQVFRDGVLAKMSIHDLVPGDVVYISAGDKVPADGAITRSPGLLVDESVLTGESMPVIKTQFSSVMKRDHQMFQGTMVVQGEAQMVVLSIGGETQYGKLGNLLENIAEQKTPLQKKVNDLVKKLAVGAIIIALFIGFVVGREQGLLKGVLGTLTIAMSIIPEEFPIVFSVFLIMGVWRLSKRKALARKMVMVETLGSVTTICVDKTGTLTEGKMALEKFFMNGQLIDAKSVQDLKPVAPLIQAAVLALERVAVDPMEVEMQRYAKAKQVLSDNFYSSFKLLKDSSFNAETKMVSHIWQGADKSCHQYTAGAPESVVRLCQFSDTAKKEVVRAYEKLADEGYRVVAIAKTPTSDCSDFISSKLEFAGLVAMSDPPRYGVKEAIAVCKEAGIKVMMITGDHALTAKTIAARIGLETRGAVVEGQDLDVMSQEKLQEIVRERSIFARIRPDQKYMIVEALQANEEIVAMTGDGVNDAPALKKATIGIAMGQKGTAVAREAAGIVLLDDNFLTIVKAVEEGRRIYGNLRQAFVFLFSFHLPIIGLAVFPLFLGQGLYFLPIHIIFLEMFSDPSTVLGLEKDPIHPGAMKQPPHDPNEPLVNSKLWWQIGWQATGIFGVSLWFYGYGIWNSNLSLGRTMSFMALVISQLILVLINRHWVQVKKNVLLLFLLFLTGVCLHIIVFTPSISKLFHFVALPAMEYLYTLTVSIFAMLFFNVIAQGSDKVRSFPIPGR